MIPEGWAISENVGVMLAALGERRLSSQFAASPPR
jgi:hypothetical protein